MDDNEFNRQNNNAIGNDTLSSNLPDASTGMNATQEMPKGDGVDVEKKSRKKLAIGIGLSALVLMVVIIAVVMTMVMQRKDTDNGGNDNSGSASIVDDEEDEDTDSDGAGENDEYANAVEISTLSSGTVTTTIGGKKVSYTAKYVVDGVTAKASGGTYESTSDNEVVFLVINGGKLLVENAMVNKTGSVGFDGRGDDYSFYGTNSAIVVAGKDSESLIDNSEINTSVNGANAVVATNAGEVTFVNSKISTTKDASRGLHATYGGTINGLQGEISTLGQSCAALATDRGAGTVSVSFMKLSTAGAGSPLIYSTGDIEVLSSTGTATGAQIAVIEGKNSVSMVGCDFSANGVGNRGSVDNAGIMIYQSMSGDASVGKGEFYAVDSTLTVLPESSVYSTTPFFFVTNTEAEIELSNVVVNFYADGYFVLAAGTNEWGKTGANGGIVTINATNLTATNTNLGVDEISSVTGL